jgi:hypothetical protein
MCSPNPVGATVNINSKKDACANHNYGTEEKLRVRRYLRCIGQMMILNLPTII